MSRHPGWRGPQHEDDPSIGADDGTRWVWSPHSDGYDWTWWEPGEDGCMLATEDVVRRDYPEVADYRDQRQHKRT